MPDLLIIGAGYTGQRLAHAALGDHKSVCATSRSPQTLELLERAGASALRLDLLNDDIGATLSPHITPETWIIYSAPTLFDAHDPGGSPPRHVRPVARVLDAAAGAHAAGFIYLSSTSVYGDHGGERVDEESACAPSSAAGKMRLDIEDHIMGREGELAHLCVARLVGIYGPGRTLKDYIERGRYKLVDGGQKRTNRVHVDDIVSALQAMMARAPTGAHLYNVSDGSPQAVADMVRHVCALTGMPMPPSIGMEELIRTRGESVAARWKNTYWCENEKLRKTLSWQPTYPDALAGYGAIFGAQSHDST